MKESFPETLMLRDTGMHDDMGGLGQRIFTTAGAGYEKVRYIRADLVNAALAKAEASLADIGDADREPGDDVAWCERRAANDESTAALALLSRMRFACGDNGLRMQDELEEYLRESKRNAERYRWLRDARSQDSNNMYVILDGAVTHYVADGDLDAAIDAAMSGANT